MPLSLVLLALACNGTASDSGAGDSAPVGDSGISGDSGDTASAGLLEQGDAFERCDSPVTGFDRLAEGAAEAGLAWVAAVPDFVVNPRVIGLGLVAHDLDGDGDVDLLLTDLGGGLTVFGNDGTGGFTAHAVPGPAATSYGELRLVSAAADLDGDGLPELLTAGPGQLWLRRNLGGLAFAEPEALLPTPAWPRTAHLSIALLDADADGDLDIFLPGLDSLVDETSEANGYELPLGLSSGTLLAADGDTWSVTVPWPASSEPGLSFVALHWDADGDGSTDLWVASDRAGPNGAPASAFFTGSPLAPDDGSAGLSLPLSAMGIDAWDWSGDGLLDLVVSDLGEPVALQSVGGRFVQAQEALRLDVPHDLPGYWFGWSTEAVDIDNDGLLDLAMVAGHPVQQTFAPDKDFPQNNALWRGSSAGFEERSAQVGFDDPGDQYGLVAADLSGDGTAELIWSGREGLSLFNNPCGGGHALVIDLLGPSGNSEGIGALLELWVNGERQLRPMHGPRALGQGPSLVHVGLGDATEVERAVVRWPDGAISDVGPLAAGQRWKVHHPARPL